MNQSLDSSDSVVVKVPTSELSDTFLVLKQPQPTHPRPRHQSLYKAQFWSLLCIKSSLKSGHTGTHSRCLLLFWSLRLRALFCSWSCISWSRFHTICLGNYLRFVLISSATLLIFSTSSPVPCRTLTCLLFLVPRNLLRISCALLNNFNVFSTLTIV